MLQTFEVRRLLRTTFFVANDSQQSRFHITNSSIIKDLYRNKNFCTLRCMCNPRTPIVQKLPPLSARLRTFSRTVSTPTPDDGCCHFDEGEEECYLFCLCGQQPGAAHKICGKKKKKISKLDGVRNTCATIY